MAEKKWHHTQTSVKMKIKQNKINAFKTTQFKRNDKVQNLELAMLALALNDIIKKNVKYK
jgi:uncharacterized protein with FMN-binding domain